MVKVKRLWSKSTDPHLSMLIYRATPLENGYTPLELLMGCQVKANLPTTGGKLREIPDIADREVAIRQRTIRNYNTRHRAEVLPQLEPGMSVHIRDSGQEGTVLGAIAPRSYTVRTNHGGIVRRNRRALIDNSSPDTVSAEGRTGRFGLQASHSERVPEEEVAEGRTNASTSARPATRV